MPSSSLFLRSSATLISVLSLFSCPTTAASNQYTNVKTYSGNGFYDGFNFFTDADPTHGFVTYVDKNTAINTGLTRLENGAFRMGVDSDNVYDPNAPYYGKNGYGRPSVRLESKDPFTKGLFIIDILHMPGNVCGIWPAFWTTVAANTWPVGGEIDIVESISNRDISMAVLHTNGSSVINSDKSTMSGTVQTTDCRYDLATNSNAAGCAIANTDPGNYGAGLNSNGGRIFAMEWADDTIKVWSFPRSSYPKDIDSGNPDPSTWGLPVQNFAGSGANIKSNFFNHKIVINTDFCGDFGDAVWSGEGCAASTGYNTCEAFVANNPAAFVDQYWKISSLKVFQRPGTSSSSTTSSTSTTASTSTVSSSSSTSSTTSPSGTNRSGFTTITLSSGSSAITTATVSSISISTVTDPIVTRSSSDFTFSTISPTSRGFTFTNGSSTIPTTSISTSSYSDELPTTNTYTNTLSSLSTISWPSTTGSGTFSPSTSASTSPVTAPIISATGFPGYAQGGAVATQNWAAWATPDPTPPFITTTITTSYFVPCSTGLSTNVVSVVTSFAGGKKVTYTPKLAVTSYTSSCPTEWGFGSVVTITVPVTTTVTYGGVKTGSAGDGKGGKGNGNGNGSGSSNGNGSGNGDSNNGFGGGSNGGSTSNSGSNTNSGNNWGNGSNSGSGSSSSNNNGSGSNSGNGSGSVSNNGSGSSSNSGSGNNGYASGFDGSSNSGSNSNTGNGAGWPNTPDAASRVPSDGSSSGSPTAGGYAAASTAYYYGTNSGSGSGSSSGSGSASGSGSGSNWSSWSNSNVTSPIATYKGAAPRVASVGSLVVAVVVGALGLMM